MAAIDRMLLMRIVGAALTKRRRRRSPRSQKMRNVCTGLLCAAVIAAGASAALADPIEGMWLRQNGTLIEYASTGGENYCGTVMSGDYQGQSIGCMAGADGAYAGKVNKLDEGKTYNGKASISGDVLSLSGCIAGGLLCKTEKLQRQ
jgi:uncharacterized protein (DUF2147 family)